MKYLTGFILGLLFASAIGGGFYLTNQYKISPKDATPLVADIPGTMTEIVPSVTPMVPDQKAPLPTQSAQKMKITGALGYPSSFVPAMKICLYTYAGPGMIQGPTYCTTTSENQMTYTLMGDIQPTTYVVFAWPSTAADKSELAGSYTPAVACGLSVSCTDHAPIVLDLSKNTSITGADIKDWYATSGTFPVKPAESGIML